MKNIIFLSIFIYFLIEKAVLGYSCDYEECSCVDNMITCVDMSAPNFKFRATVTILYMENVQLLNLRDIIKNLPNLRYLTLMNMKYFNCKWISNLPDHIHLKTNMCHSTGGYIDSSEPSTPDQSVSENYNQLSTQIRFNSSTLDYSTSQKYYGEIENRSSLERLHSRRFMWIIILTVVVTVIVLTVTITTIIICKRKLRNRVQITESDDITMQPLSDNLIQESSIDFSG